jgi:Protein of unknown function (DUF2490)
VVRLGALALLVSIPGTAAIAQESASEVWPAVNIYWRPAEHYRTFVDLSASSEREGAKRESTVGIYQDYLRLPRAFVRIGYGYTFSTRDDSYRESRLVGELNLGRDLPRTLRLVNRLRGELRWVNGEQSYRVRDRIHLQRGTRGILHPRLKPYGTVEAYYDSRYRTIARIGGKVGSDVRLTEHVGLDVYVARQDNSRTEPRHVNALGLTVTLSY